MKALLMLILILNIFLVFYIQKRDKDIKKTLFTLGLFIMLSSMATFGMMTRPLISIFLLHVIFLIISWGSILWYIFKDKYYMHLHLSPFITLTLYMLGEVVFGSSWFIEESKWYFFILKFKTKTWKSKYILDTINKIVK